GRRCLGVLSVVLGARRGKSCWRFVARSVADVVVPASMMLVVLGTQVAGVASVAACSNLKPGVSAEGQETFTSEPERRIESSGRGSRYARAMYADTFPPAVVNKPPAYKSVPDTASAFTSLFSPEPSADQLLPFHLAT